MICYFNRINLSSISKIDTEKVKNKINRLKDRF